MALHIENREVNGMAVLALSGRIVLGKESSALREKVNGLFAAGNKKTILNVDRVGYIDSSGLGIGLVPGPTNPRRAGYEKVCFCPNDRLRSRGRASECRPYQTHPPNESSTHPQNRFSGPYTFALLV